MRAGMWPVALPLAVLATVLPAQVRGQDSTTAPSPTSTPTEEQWDGDGPPPWVTGTAQPPWGTGAPPWGSGPPPWIDQPDATSTLNTFKGSFAMLYPTGTPTVNYLDQLTLAWSASGDFVSAIIACGDGDPGVPLYQSSVINPSLTVNEFVNIGQWPTEAGQAASFPVTCSASIVPRSIGDNYASPTFPSAGTFVVTSAGPLDAPRTGYGMSATTAITAESATANVNPEETAPANGNAEGTNGDEGSGGGLSTGAKAGLAVGIIAAALLAAIAAFLFYRRHRLSKKSNTRNPSEMEGGEIVDPRNRSEMDAKSTAQYEKENAGELGTGMEDKHEMHAEPKPVEADPQHDHVVGPFEMPADNYR